MSSTVPEEDPNSAGQWHPGEPDKDAPDAVPDVEDVTPIE